MTRGANNLAVLYRAQGKYAEAEPLSRRALEIREQELGPRHPDTALSLNNLAGLYKTQGKYAEAEPLYQRALGIYEQELGPIHPSTRIGRKNYAGLLRELGREEEAVALERENEGERSSATASPCHQRISPGESTSLTGGNEVVEIGQGDLEGRAVFVGFECAAEGLAANGAFALSDVLGGFCGADKTWFIGCTGKEKL